MKKFFAKILCAGAFLALLAPVAKADTISGSISIAGSDTFNSTGINFNPSTGIVLSSTISGVTALETATLTSFSYASASGVTLFSTLANGSTLSFIINSLTMVDLSTANFLNLAGTGTFTENGSSTSGTFSLTSSTTGITSFQLVSTTAATPEPNSLMLLGTGLIGTASMLVRRRRASAMVA